MTVVIKLWRSGLPAFVGVLSVVVLLPAPATAGASTFALQPITMQRINLPSSVADARWPVFAPDGQHLLFFSDNELWITDLQGTGTRCLSCGVTNDPEMSGAAALATPFPDGKRVLIEEDLQPITSKLAVLECEPSLADCQNVTIDPVDFSAAEPLVIPPGGVDTLPQETLATGEYHAKLSQDGQYIGFSEARSDTLEAMVVSKLVKSGDEYITTDSKVINPPAPTSASDKNIGAWEDASSLTELKGFDDGGADATYVQVGGPTQGTEIWSVNLATGRRTELTDNPDWNEDNGVSPDGKLISLFSDRTINYSDWIGGLLPVNDFIASTGAAMAAGALGGWSECMGPMWLLPSSGDDGGTLAGEPLVDYRYPGIHAVDSLAEENQWSPNGTMIALDTMQDSTGTAAPFILVAHLHGVTPSRPLPVVSSEPGSWAPSPTGYHGVMGFVGTVTLPGPKGGSATVTYGGAALGDVAGMWTETYRDFTDDGTDFFNGTETIDGTALAGSYSEHITETGANTGSDDTNLTFSSEGTSGSAESTYDGRTITGPGFSGGAMAAGGSKTACPSHLPRPPQLRLTVLRRSRTTDRVLITASIADVGPEQTETDTQPVEDATIRAGRRAFHTNTRGIATVRLTRRTRVTVTAGQTLTAASQSLRP